MSDNSSIEWTDTTWNPVTGCTKVSPGCGIPRFDGDKPGGCYAEAIARRFAGSKAFPNGFDVTLHPERLDLPLRWKKPRRIFVNSMSDLFHKDVPDLFIAQVFDVMEQAKHHTFQILTKRHDRMRAFVQRREDAKREYAAKFDHCPTEAMRNSPAAQDARQRAAAPPSHIWLGVSVEDQNRADLRIPALLETPAAVRWISAEPLLGPVDLRNLTARNGALIDCLGGDVKSANDGAVYTGTPSVLDWVVAGGESGPKARPMHPDWARSLRDQCTNAGVAFHFKQWGAYRWVAGDRYDAETRCWVDDGIVPQRVSKKLSGRELDGRTWDEYPTPRTAEVTV